MLIVTSILSAHSIKLISKQLQAHLMNYVKAIGASQSEHYTVHGS